MKELIFTSAPKGLKPGSRGFATVAASRQLSPPLISRLEKLGAYPFAFELNDPRSKLNPVGYSYVRLKLANQASSVLSRRVAAGVDYTGRSNTLAHHLVISSNERPAGGPAWLIATPGLFTEKWDPNQAPHYIEPVRTAPSGEEYAAICHAWAQATGDAGWGAALVRAAHQSPGQITYIIYKPGQDMLPLIRESLALLRPTLRWQIYFNTYFTDESSDVTCHWRCVLAGTPAALAARKNSRALVLNLTQPQSALVEDDYTLAARQGLLYEPAETPPTTDTPKKSSPILVSTDDPCDPDDSDEYDVSGYDIVEEEVRPPRLPMATLTPIPEPRVSKRRVIIIATASMVLCLIVFVAIIWIYQSAPTAISDESDLGVVKTAPIESEVGKNNNHAGQSPSMTFSDSEKQLKQKPGSKKTPDSTHSETTTESNQEVVGSATVPGSVGKPPVGQASRLSSAGTADPPPQSSVSRQNRVPIKKKDQYNSGQVFGKNYQPVDLNKQNSFDSSLKELILIKNKNVLKFKIDNKTSENKILFQVTSQGGLDDNVQLASLSFQQTGGNNVKILWLPNESKIKSNREKYVGFRLILADENNTNQPMVFYDSEYEQINEQTISLWVDKPAKPEKALNFLGGKLSVSQAEGQQNKLLEPTGPSTFAESKEGNNKIIFNRAKFTIELKASDDIIKSYEDLKKASEKLKAKWDHKKEYSNSAGQKASESRKQYRKQYQVAKAKFEIWKKSMSVPITVLRVDKYNIPISKLTIHIDDLPALDADLEKAAETYDEAHKK